MENKEIIELCNNLPGLSFDKKSIIEREEEASKLMAVADMKRETETIKINEIHAKINKEHCKLNGQFSGFHKNILWNKSLKYVIEKPHQYTIACDNKTVIKGELIKDNQGKIKVGKMFHSFNDWESMYTKLIMKTKNESDLREFYEVIEAHHKRKPYFDIDLALPSDINVDDLIENIKKAIKEEMLTRIHQYEHDNTCIFQSHSDSKISFHIIINNYCVKDNDQMQALFNHVLKRVPKKYKDKHGLFDASVYHNNAQFRMYKSHKLGTTRTKELTIEYDTYSPGPLKNLNDDVQKKIWYASLITYTNECELLKEYEIKSVKYEKSEFPMDDDIQDQIEILLKNNPMSNQFKFRKGNPYLHRIRKGDCTLHHRIHESNNAYLYIKDNTLYFICLSSPAKRIALGSIILPVEKEENKILIDHSQVADLTLPYEEIKEQFEKIHFKCVLSSCYYTIGVNDITIHTEKKLVESYRHLKCKIFTLRKGIQIEEKITFITHWINDEYIRRYDKVGLYPTPFICPPETYNLWNGWRIENINIKESDNDDYLLIFDHIKKIFGNECSNYALDWIANLLQKPGLLPKAALLLKSLEGLGKGFLIELLKILCGKQYVLLTKKVDRDVFGKFNALLENRIIVCLDEMSVKMAREYEDDLKDYIVNPDVSINPKNRNQYETNNFVHLISFSNLDWPWVISESDRRYLAVDSSEVEIPDRAYFEKLFQLLSDDAVMKKVYRTFMKRDITKFQPQDSRPETEFTKDLKEVNRPLELNFIINFIKDLPRNSVQDVSAKDLFDFYNVYIIEHYNNIKITTNTIKLGIKIKNLHIKGFSKKKGNSGNLTSIDVDEALQWCYDKKYLDFE